MEPGRICPPTAPPSPGRQFCGRTRREFLWEAGGGFASVALTALLGGDGFLARQAVAADGVDAVRQPDGPEAAASSGQGQERDLPVHVRRAQPRRHVRLQAQALRARRQDDPGQDVRPRRQEERGPGRRPEVAVQAVRPVRQDGSPTCSRTWPPASTTSPSSTRCTPSRRSTARPC